LSNLSHQIGLHRTCGQAVLALDYQGPIVDAATNQSVLADVFVNGQLIEQRTDVANARLTFEASGQSVTLSVIAMGYEPWTQTFQAGGDHTTINAVVKLIPSQPAAAAPADQTSTAPSAPSSVLLFQSHITDATTHLPVIADLPPISRTIK
jgi:hypothetical protein